VSTKSHIAGTSNAINSFRSSKKLSGVKGVKNMNWYLEVFKKYAVFSGRARRKEYWMFFLFNIIVAFAIGIVIGIFRGAFHINLSILSSLYSLAILIPSTAVGVRRMHDTNHSGWWLIVPIAGLIFLFLNGQPSNNRFGLDPKAVTS
jgi:uncharacterized membrane protein YhaH (DUF805 family)